MSKFVRVQIVTEEVFKIPADWDLKDITYRSGKLFYKGKAYTNLQSIQIESMNDCEIFLEDDDGLNEMYMDAMPDEED